MERWATIVFMAKKKQPDFSPEELAQVKRHGEALLGQPTDFDDAVEAELADHYPEEASAEKMHAAQTGGGDQGLGPSEMDEAAIKQRSALAREASTQAAAQAAQAQAGQSPVNAPAAPGGPAGTTEPYPAQKGAVGGPGNVQPPSQAAAPPAPGGSPSPDQGEEEEEGPPQ